ncbi:Serine phosphatase RsbU, regulator of sigma subunit [Marivirga sericea]|uniref:Serine phosphatase RsbU, regulator of sigma subunit n=1 Tax=Marivirga sericea TaxID=1028 RepID=A0A1X7I6D1_9BACT|nr:tetratricopeptide repeat protein [Marivirga sericea]SMG10069.1 Serine phosphatase RsbU, regulator of sigma subunit [Marivirga sericea]
MVHRIFILLLFVSSHILYGEQSTDSLRNLLETNLHDSSKLQIYKELLYSFSTSDPSQAILYGTKGLELAQKKTDKLAETQFLNNLGIAYYGLGDYEKTLNYFLQVLKMEKDRQSPQALSRAMNNVGIIFEEIGRLDRAAEYYQQSLKIKEEFSDSLGISNTMSNLGLLFMKRELPEKAIKYFRASYKIDKDFEYTVGIYNSLHNIGVYHKDYGDVDSAVYYIERALLAVPTGQKNYDKAYIEKSLAESYLKKEEFAQAEKYFKRAISSGAEVKAIEVLKSSYNGLSTIYELKQQYKQSLLAYKKYKKLNDSIFNQDFTAKVSQLEKNFEIDSKEKEIQLLKTKAEITGLQLIRRENSNYFLIVLGILLAVLALISYNRYNIKNRAHRLLKLKNDEINLQKAEIQENRDEIEAQRDSIIAQKLALEEATADTTNSIKYAQNIQRAILPDLKSVKSAFNEFFMLYLPKSIVSGDFYWFAQRKHKTYFALADCTGHGIPGAFMTVMANDLLNSIVNQQGIEDCAEILKILDRSVLNSLQYKENSSNDGLDIALLCFDQQRQEVNFAGASMDLIVFQDDNWELIKGQRFSIGGMVDSFDKKARNITLKVKQDMQIYIYSDGFVDQFGGAENKKFMRKKLMALLDEIKLRPFTEQRAQLRKSILDWKGEHEQTDDISIAGIRI